MRFDMIVAGREVSVHTQRDVVMYLAEVGEKVTAEIVLWWIDKGGMDRHVRMEGRSTDVAILIESMVL